MFDQQELDEVVQLHQKSYELLRWVGRNLRSGTLDFGVAHEAASTFDAAMEWISRHWNNLPESVRPTQPQLKRFARLFSSYLTTSFKLVEKPRTKLISYCGCYCSYCAYLGQANRLQVKSPSKGAKRAAADLKSVYIHAMAQDLGYSITALQINDLLSNELLMEPLALATYGHELIRRSKFASQGEGVLALWREFAWDENRYPKANFELNFKDILAAERQVISHLQEAAIGPSGPSE